MCLLAYLASVVGILTIVVLGESEGDLFGRYLLKDHLLTGLPLTVIFHPINQQHNQYTVNSGRVS